MVPLVKVQQFNRKSVLHRTKPNNWLKMHGLPKRRKPEMRIRLARLNYGLVIGHLGVGKSFHHLRYQLYSNICTGEE